MYLSRPMTAWPSESKPIRARVCSGRVHTNRIGFFIRGRSRSGEVQNTRNRSSAKAGRHGARNEAAQWLSPRRDMITGRDLAELTERDCNAYGHGHVHLDSFWSWSCMVMVCLSHAQRLLYHTVCVCPARAPPSSGQNWF